MTTKDVLVREQQYRTQLSELLQRHQELYLSSDPEEVAELGRIQQCIEELRSQMTGAADALEAVQLITRVTVDTDIQAQIRKQARGMFEYDVKQFLALKKRVADHMEIFGVSYTLRRFLEEATIIDYRMELLQRERIVLVVDGEFQVESDVRELQKKVGWLRRYLQDQLLFEIPRETGRAVTLASDLHRLRVRATMLRDEIPTWEEQLRALVAAQEVYDIMSS